MALAQGYVMARHRLALVYIDALTLVMLNKLRYHAHILLSANRYYLIQVVYANSYSK